MAAQGGFYADFGADETVGSPEHITKGASPMWFSNAALFIG